MKTGAGGTSLAQDRMMYPSMKHTLWQGGKWITEIAV